VPSGGHSRARMPRKKRALLHPPVIQVEEGLATFARKAPRVAAEAHKESDVSGPEVAEGMVYLRHNLTRRHST
jgi:hypothetical protein